jgi:hypothetical protein
MDATLPADPGRLNRYKLRAEFRLEPYGRIL